MSMLVECFKVRMKNDGFFRSHSLRIVSSRKKNIDPRQFEKEPMLLLKVIVKIDETQNRNNQIRAISIRAWVLKANIEVKEQEIITLQKCHVAYFSNKDKTMVEQLL